MPPHPSHCPWFDNPIISGDEYKLWRSPLYSFLQPQITSSFLVPRIFLSTLFSKIMYALPLIWLTKFHACTKQLAEVWFCIF
jgi:hypothetical protein